MSSIFRFHQAPWYYLLTGADFNPKTAGAVEANTQETRFYAVDGDAFVLRYSEAITLNIQYVRLTPEDVVPDAAASLSSQNGPPAGETAS